MSDLYERRFSDWQNQAIVSTKPRMKPSRPLYVGCHPNSSLALELSAHKRSTSEFSGLQRSSEEAVSTVVFILSAIKATVSPIDISKLLPRFMT